MGEPNPTPPHEDGYWVLGSVSVIAPVLWWNVLLSGVLARAGSIIVVGSLLGLGFGLWGGLVVCRAARTGRVSDGGKRKLFLLGLVGLAFSLLGFGPLLVWGHSSR
jgi:hypothetical protein